MNTGRRILLGLGLVSVLAAGASAAEMGTAFTYEGFLEDDGVPITASCDFEFSLWDADVAGMEKGNSPQSAGGVDVEDGLFTVAIDFGSGAFNGDARWLVIKVCCPSPGCVLDPLAPRVELTPAPHALALPGLWTEQNGTIPNLIGGYEGNIVGAGLVGASVTTSERRLSHP